MTIMSGRVFRFRTLDEANFLVDRLDTDTELRKQMKENFYRSTLLRENVLYCVLLHPAELPEVWQKRLLQHGRDSGGEIESDSEIRQSLIALATKRWLAAPDGNRRWDAPDPKESTSVN